MSLHQKHPRKICAQNTWDYNPSFVKQAKGINKIIEDAKEQHTSELEKLKTEMIELT